MSIRGYYIYIITNKYNTVYYVGITNDIKRRVFEHKNKLVRGFTSRYNIDKLIYYEQFANVAEALMREKQLKGYGRKKKLQLIMQMNPHLTEIVIS